MTEPKLHTAKRERVAFAIERTMFAPHEFPLPDELHQKYLVTADAAIEAMAYKKHWDNPPYGCERCGEADCCPNTEAFELSGEVVCDECAEEILEDNSQFGAGA
jgi:formylmethanofuran dehydrogenase subunit E